MQKKIIKTSLLLLVSAFATITVVAFLIWNEPHQNVKDEYAVKLNANTLYNLLSKADSEPYRAFINEVVEVSGKVKNVLVNNEGHKIILLETAVDGAFINCTVEEKTVAIRAGEQAEIKGICLGYMNGDAALGLPGDVFLTRCYVIQNH